MNPLTTPKPEVESDDRTIVRFLYNIISPPQLKSTIILIYLTLALCAWKSLPVKPVLDGLNQEALPIFLWGSWKLCAAAVLFGFLPVFIIKFIFRESLADYGLQRGIFKRFCITAGIMTPIMIIIGYNSGSITAFDSVYPLNPAAFWGVRWLALHSFLYAILYYISYEFFFRGFLLRGLSDSCGLINALLIQACAATCFHFGHPGCELWGSFFGSLWWGFIAIRTNSIWSGWLQHAALGIALEWSMFYVGGF